jgi:hypothetical protein
MIRRLLLLVSIVMLAALVLPETLPVQAQDGVNAWASLQANLRIGPGTRYTLLATLPANAPVTIEARNADTSWILVKTQAARGWGKTLLFRLADGVKLRAFPVSTEILPQPPAAEGGPPSTGGAALASLNAPFVPRITPAIRYAMRALIEKGKKLGNNIRVFSKVGDCQTALPAFMSPFSWGDYNLGQYRGLQQVIDYFKVSPRPDVANSFDAASFAAHNGFNASAVLQPEFADPSRCTGGERPLVCEYRLNKPGVAIIMFGTADVVVMTPKQFDGFMRIIVKETMDAGIIPLLSTFPENPALAEKSREMNQLVVKLAQQKNLPLMNLADALKPLPNWGLETDGIHLTLPPGGEKAAGVFTPENLQFGYTVRNLVVLQALDVVWRQIIH